MSLYGNEIALEGKSLKKNKKNAKLFRYLCARPWEMTRSMHHMRNMCDNLSNWSLDPLDEKNTREAIENKSLMQKLYSNSFNNFKHTKLWFMDPALEVLEKVLQTCPESNVFFKSSVLSFWEFLVSSLKFYFEQSKRVFMKTWRCSLRIVFFEKMLPEDYPLRLNYKNHICR